LLLTIWQNDFKIFYVFVGVALLPCHSFLVLHSPKGEVGSVAGKRRQVWLPLICVALRRSSEQAAEQDRYSPQNQSLFKKIISPFLSVPPIAI
jgi:hypothetical protein